MPLANLLNDLLGDLRDPGLMWQLGAIVLSVLLGWSLSRLLWRGVKARTANNHVARFGVESFGRVVGPLAVVVLLWASQKMLGRFHLHTNLFNLALPIFSSLAVIRFGFYLLRRVFARGGVVGEGMQNFEKAFQLLVWLAFVLYITGFYVDLFDFLDDTLVPLGKHKVSIATILQAAVSVVVLLLLAMWAGAALEERLMNLHTMHSNLRVVIARMGRAVLILVAVLVSLSLVGIDLTVLSVFGGALGVGLGLGLQKIASNYVSGFIILLDRSLTIGNVITVDKYSGQVTQINTRYTVLQGTDGVESIVPNEMLVSGAVQNSSLTNPAVVIVTRVTVGYESDVDAVLKLMEDAALTIERVMKDKPPSGMLQAFGADGLELALAFWIADPENGRGGVTSDVNRAIWKSLKENGISVPFPQREIRLIGSLPEQSA
ncbi:MULTISPECIES: mechanosensitive ion channel family protein [unclassified Duganella]|uniref:mechanosensitive ion channel family protein n=1 Tax=unclassified Duganella TaxID=2636909 RepID=UPI0006F445C9|nr:MULTISPECIES: mechanosensitive ion channel domain-containing protein [unclassified Duganella]KQV54137.1 mechanosensitive ion channel protein [Duganella sp. Root336D2]KRB95573.1 mechanosensitive ion channel protein [Duganella sp. Root198D2]